MGRQAVLSVHILALFLNFLCAMNYAARFFFLLFTFSGTYSWSQVYSEDHKYFQTALSLYRLSDRKLEEFQNPLKGPLEFRLSAQDAPWAGNYFAMKDGGAAFRWQSRKKNDAYFKTLMPKDEILKMSKEQINQLSPAEKYDLFTSDYNFSMTQHELMHRGPLRGVAPAPWEGLCNGVRCASALLPEPEAAIEVKNAEGIEITFQPSDLKALAGVSYFFVEKYAQMGAPTQEGRAQAQPNAAAFDLALRYFLAHKKKSFAVDASLGEEIWNESVIGYHRELSAPKKLSAQEQVLFPWANSKIQVDGWLETLGEVDIQKTNGPTKNRVADGQLHKNLKFSYSLYLDSDGMARDGLWKKSRSLRGVDFMWFGAGQGTDANPENQNDNGNPYLNFKILKKLIKKSSTRTCQNIFIN